jgi:hypothetical protein
MTVPELGLPVPALPLTIPAPVLIPVPLCRELVDQDVVMTPVPENGSREVALPWLPLALVEMLALLTLEPVDQNIVMMLAVLMWSFSVA